MPARPLVAADVGRRRRERPRPYDWAFTQTTDPALPEDGQGANWLLVHRSISASTGATPEYASYRGHAPGLVLLHALVRVAGSGGRSERDSPAARNSPPSASIGPVPDLWRRRHQATAGRGHYQRRPALTVT
jgi:hypothetical protein